MSDSLFICHWIVLVGSAPIVSCLLDLDRAYWIVPVGHPLPPQPLPKPPFMVFLTFFDYLLINYWLKLVN